MFYWWIKAKKPVYIFFNSSWFCCCFVFYCSLISVVPSYVFRQDKKINILLLFLRRAVWNWRELESKTRTLVLFCVLTIIILQFCFLIKDNLQENFLNWKIWISSFLHFWLPPYLKEFMQCQLNNKAVFKHRMLFLIRIESCQFLFRNLY